MNKLQKLSFKEMNDTLKTLKDGMKIKELTFTQMNALNTLFRLKRTIYFGFFILFFIFAVGVGVAKPTECWILPVMILTAVSSISFESILNYNKSIFYLNKVYLESITKTQ